jgi:hypothetical protein
VSLKKQKTKTGQTYRFFYHYYRQYNSMSVHFRGSCYKTDNVECLVSCETKWKKTQPHLVLQGFAKEIEVLENKIVIR